MSETIALARTGHNSEAMPTFVYKPSWVANTFLIRARDENVSDVDPLKIQKLVYCLHGWHLATTDDPAIGEQFEAWPAGPVVSSLYHQFKSFRWRPITKLAHDIDPTTGLVESLVVAVSDVRFYEIFNLVWSRYRGFSGAELSAMTHAEGTPWSRARQQGRQYIPNDWIFDHFADLGSRAGV